MSEDKAKALYDELSAELGVMTKGKQSVLTKYVELSIAFSEIADQIAREGRTIRSERGGIKAHPLMTYYKSFADTLKGYATILGLTKDDGGGSDDDAFGAYLKAKEARASKGDRE